MGTWLEIYGISSVTLLRARARYQEPGDRCPATRPCSQELQPGISVALWLKTVMNSWIWGHGLRVIWGLRRVRGVGSPHRQMWGLGLQKSCQRGERGNQRYASFAI